MVTQVTVFVSDSPSLFSSTPRVGRGLRQVVIPGLLRAGGINRIPFRAIRLPSLKVFDACVLGSSCCNLFFFCKGTKTLWKYQANLPQNLATKHLDRSVHKSRVEPSLVLSTCMGRFWMGQFVLFLWQPRFIRPLSPFCTRPFPSDGYRPCSGAC